jgi:hypothetical protein
VLQGAELLSVKRPLFLLSSCPPEVKSVDVRGVHSGRMNALECHWPLPLAHQMFRPRCISDAPTMSVLSVPRTWLRKRTAWSRVGLAGKSLPRAKMLGACLATGLWTSPSTSCLDAATIVYVQGMCEEGRLQERNKKEANTFEKKEQGGALRPK